MLRHSCDARQRHCRRCGVCGSIYTAPTGSMVTVTSPFNGAASWRHGLYSAIESGRDIIEWRRRRELPVARKSSGSVLWTVTASASGLHGHKTMMIMMVMATVLWMRFISVVDSPSGSGPGGSRASSPEHPEESPGDLCLKPCMTIVLCWYVDVAVRPPRMCCTMQSASHAFRSPDNNQTSPPQPSPQAAAI